MSATCGVCHLETSKYKCPSCELRYCSLGCYKTHKKLHAEDEPKPSIRARPGTRAAATAPSKKHSLQGFENDPDLLHLLSRYPLLKLQLQTVYGLTLEPGPDEARSWNRPTHHSPNYRGRGGRGRGRGRGGRGGHQADERQHGPWTQDKGDKEAMTMIKRARNGNDGKMEGEGMREFIELCKIKFGSKDEPADQDMTDVIPVL